MNTPLEEQDDARDEARDETFVRNHLAGTGGCPPFAELRAAGQGVLTPEAEQRIARHLEVCGLCPILLADLATLPAPALTAVQQQRIRQTIDRAPALRPGRSRGSYVFHSLAATAAALLIAVTAILGVQRLSSLRRNSQNHIATGSTIAPVEIAAAALPAPADAAGLTMRGSPHATGPTTPELLAAFTPYNHADYSEAEKQFSALSATYPEDARTLLYLGVSQLMQNENREAYPTLLRAETRQTGTGKSAALWYRAVAAWRLDYPEARSLFHTLCTGPQSAFAALGCKAETDIDHAPK